MSSDRVYGFKQQYSAKIGDSPWQQRTLWVTNRRCTADIVASFQSQCHGACKHYAYALQPDDLTFNARAEREEIPRQESYYDSMDFNLARMYSSEPGL